MRIGRGGGGLGHWGRVGCRCGRLGSIGIGIGRRLVGQWHLGVVGVRPGVTARALTIRYLRVYFLRLE